MLLRQNAWSEKQLLKLLKKINLRVLKTTTKCTDVQVEQKKTDAA